MTDRTPSFSIRETTGRVLAPVGAPPLAGERIVEVGGPVNGERRAESVRESTPKASPPLSPAVAQSCLRATQAIRRANLPAPARERLLSDWRAAPFDECEATMRINAERDYLRSVGVLRPAGPRR